MKERKFPVVPAAILGVALLGGGYLASNKPLTGTVEEVSKAIQEREQAKQDKLAKKEPAGEGKDAELEKSMQKSMVDAKTPQKGRGPRDKNGKTIPLILQGKPTVATKPVPNDSSPQGQWYQKQHGDIDGG